jgi:hypothetical protein
MKIIDIKVHTIVVLMGKDDNIKSNFAHDILIPQLNQLPIESKNFKVDIKYINLTKKILLNKVDSFSTYPTNTEYIILNFDKDFLIESEDISKIANKNNYNIKTIIFDDIKFNISSFSNVTKINRKNILDYKIISSNYNDYINRILEKKYNWVTIGDIHGSIYELKELIKKFGFKIINNVITGTNQSKNIGLILAGDIIDKASGNDIKETLEFIHKNMSLMGERMQLILGNHEEMVYRWITNSPYIKKTPKSLKERDIFYNTFALIEKNTELRKIFLDIYNNMKSWVKYIANDKGDFIVTHSPCENNILEKLDENSIHKQVKSTSRSKNPNKTNDELTSYLIKEANIDDPIHIFGHLGQSTIRTFKNKVCIDTSCIYGYKLIGYMVNNDKPIIKSVNNKRVNKDKKSFKNKLFRDI